MLGEASAEPKISKKRAITYGTLRVDNGYNCPGFYRTAILHVGHTAMRPYYRITIFCYNNCMAIMIRQAKDWHMAWSECERQLSF